MSSPIPFAIHGFGRIGRALARAAHGDSRLELVAVNDLASAGQMACLLRRDSVHGRFPTDVADGGDGTLRIGTSSVRIFGEREPARIPWQDTAARVVVDCSGGAVQGGAQDHLRPGGPQRVLVSALARSVDLTLCRGVNDGVYDADRHRLVSAASCTTNCLALVLKVLHERFGVRRALMNEVHSYTGNQALVDGPHDDPRRARAAALNIVPTSTAAPDAVAALLPALRGRLAGQAVRVPTPDVALLDLVATLEPAPVAAAAIDEALRDAYRQSAVGELRGLLAVSNEPLVSTDHVGDHHSAIVDLPLVQSIGGGGSGDDLPLVRVVAWYDNETGYAHRLAELIHLLAS